MSPISSCLYLTSSVQTELFVYPCCLATALCLPYCNWIKQTTFSLGTYVERFSLNHLSMKKYKCIYFCLCCGKISPKMQVFTFGKRATQHKASLCNLATRWHCAGAHSLSHDRQRGNTTGREFRLY